MRKTFGKAKWIACNRGKNGSVYADVRVNGKRL